MIILKLFVPSLLLSSSIFKHFARFLISSCLKEIGFHPNTNLGIWIRKKFPHSTMLNKLRIDTVYIGSFEFLNGKKYIYTVDFSKCILKLR